MQTIPNTNRESFGRTKHVLDYPDFLDIQLESFEKFVQLDIAPNERENQGLQRVEGCPAGETKAVVPAFAILAAAAVDCARKPPHLCEEERQAADGGDTGQEESPEACDLSFFARMAGAVALLFKIHRERVRLHARKAGQAQISAKILLADEGVHGRR